MILSLIVGLVLGAVSVVFALQNTAIVTVTLFSWQLTEPLAFVLLGSMVAGGIVALLVLLPSVIRDEVLFSMLRAERDELEAEATRLRTELRRKIPPPGSDEAALL